ncbi:hypothetical protein EK403_12015 [Hansschlegelia zhihuaiae]|uniref:Uncharacterized protein n=1 Tax=Hansschlegelia zhihuaiae TaxID=405005 RepID=A0A4Q0MI30_9HYPH|nr:hypothetical protein EK403_12015 [Hansschlegelia zhihuaiae]
MAIAANAPLFCGPEADPDALKAVHGRVCELERNCADFAIVLIARRRPVACDLRAIVASLRIAAIADMAFFAKTGRRITSPSEGLGIAREPLASAA